MLCQADKDGIQRARLESRALAYPIAVLPLRQMTLQPGGVPCSMIHLAVGLLDLREQATYVEAGWRRIRSGIATLFPGYFALVMATGIVSLAANLLDEHGFAWTLYLVNILFAAVLIVLTAARVALHFRQVVADLVSHAGGPGFFTLVAALGVLGVQVSVFQGGTDVASILWVVAALFWLVLLYTFFSAIIVASDKPALASGLSGAWLLGVVSTEALSLLAAKVAASSTGAHPLWQFAALASFLLGAVLYLFITALLFYRFTFFELAPSDLTPLYWVNMGAAAITSLAGTTLVLDGQQWPFIQSVLQVLSLGSLAFWVAGMWWVPLLLILLVWRHVVRAHPITYSPQYWGLVFPLGMYTAATAQLAMVTGYAFLLAIAHVTVWIAIGVWLITLLAMARNVTRFLFPATDATHNVD